MVDTKNAENSKYSTEYLTDISNEYRGYPDIFELYKRKAKDCPKGVRLKLQKQRFLMLQFNDPLTGKVTVKASGEQFTDDGIINAVNKAWMISDALTDFDTIGNFWRWYDENILGKTKMIEILKTYHEIFTELENAYFNGQHKNTKRKRSREISSDVRSFKNVYLNVFERFTKANINIYGYPSIQDFKTLISHLNTNKKTQQGTKTFKDCGTILKKIAGLSHDATRIAEYLNSVDFTQTQYTEKQSIDYQSYLNWYKSKKVEIENRRNSRTRKSGLAWLWITAMSNCYGLRPSEVMAAKNIDTSYQVDGVTFKAITDSSNKDKLLYLGEWTSNSCSIKTGKRACVPLVSATVLKELEIENFPGFPHVRSGRADAITDNYRDFLNNNNCPVTQAYAFRHLANQLGELNGIPQEIRARSLGHSVAVNESVYKKRSNLKTSVDILSNHKKHPLPLNMAIEKLKALGVDTDDKNVQLFLGVVYQIEK